MAEPEKRKILLRLKPGETKTIGGVTITAHEDNTSLVYIGKKGNTPVVWANKRALVSLNFKGEASALEMLEMLKA